jgi:hypothetical protein
MWSPRVLVVSGVALRELNQGTSHCVASVHSHCVYCGQVKRMLREVETVVDANGVQDNALRGNAAQWWKNYLLICDWLPNEQKIQIRGPPYEFLHKEVYGPAAHEAKLYLAYKTWMSCKKEGLILVAQLLKDADPAKLTAARSARHSK